MTPEVKEFIKENSKKLEGKVLEVGSYNVNGSCRDHVKVDVGIDIRTGPGVDFVLDVKDLMTKFKPGEFDACVSTETLEHVEDWKAFVRNTWDVVKNEGWLVITMASMKKGKHDYPNDYWRFSLEQIRQIYPEAISIKNLGRVSIGCVVQKKGELPDLDAINPKSI